MGTVETELRRLFDRDGTLTAEQVVTAATPATSPLHSYFEWDNDAAGTKWRLEQARGLIRSCKIVIEAAEDRTYHVRAFTNVPGEHYAPTERVLSDSRSRDLVLSELQRELKALRYKYQRLCDFDAALRASLESAA